LYDWVLKEIGYEAPSRQIEFARMNLNYTLTSKRRCLRLVKDNIVSGWDDPRMSTLCGMRRRGYTAEAIRDFCERIGVSKANSVIDFALLEACIRDDLNKRAPRAMAVIRPIKLIIDNYPEGQVEQIEVEVNPEDPNMGTRTVEFSRELYIEEDDFMEDAPKKYFRLSPGREVRLKGAYYVTCTGCDKDENGNVVAVHCTYDPETRGGDAPDGRKVKGTIHFVSAANAIDAEVRLYDRLFTVENPSDESVVNDFTENLNPNSMVVLKNAKLDASITDLKVGDTFQFLRLGYFCVDPDSTKDMPVFNRTVALRDAWKKVSKS
jgi:glutaminyl-tRNA synthetase